MVLFFLVWDNGSVGSFWRWIVVGMGLFWCGIIVVWDHFGVGNVGVG